MDCKIKKYINQQHDNIKKKLIEHIREQNPYVWVLRKKKAYF